MAGAAAVVPVGPTALSSRALGPDLARGVMLAFIALANTHYFLAGDAVLGGFPEGGSRLDRVVVWLVVTFVDGRSFPLFGLLFGYGVAQIVRRHPGPPPATRRLLRRRSAALIGIGLVDAFLFYVGDIVAMYGVLLFAGAFLVRLRGRWLLVVALPLLVLNALPGAGSLVTSTATPDAATLPPDLATQLVERVPVVAVVALLGPLGFVAPFLAGLWAGRKRALERPHQHRRLLGTAAVLGVVASVLGAQPAALVVSGAIDPPDERTLAWFGSLDGLTGLLGGCGYAALIVLISTRLRADGRATRAIVATGQRSLTCYLLQSVVWTAVFTPYLLDLSGVLSIAQTALLATATWLLSVVLADRMRAAGIRGPFEVLVRRATYGRTAATTG